MTEKKKKIIRVLILLIGVPVLLLIGGILLNDRKYNLISVGIMLLACVPILYKYEKKESSMLLMVIIAVLSAIAIVSRAAFILVPHVKPMTAVIIIAGLYLGSEEGFLVGALSAIGSNIFFGQGPWTPFQMFTWGMIGFIAGIPWVSKKCRENKVVLILLGIFSGLLFSVIMDAWSVLSFQEISLARYGLLLLKGLPITATYMVSNIVFLLLLQKPIGDVLNRLQVKYGFKEKV